LHLFNSFSSLISIFFFKINFPFLCFLCYLLNIQAY
jgi:hypothetical protein